MMSFADLMSAARHRLGTMLLVAGVVFALIFGIALAMPRQYTAASSLLVDLSQTDPATNNTNANNTSVIDSIIGTQVDIIRSDTVVREVVQRRARASGQTLSGTALQDAITSFTKHLGIGTEKGSNVIHLSFAARSPKDAADTLNTLVDVFLAKQVDLRINPARQNASLYDDRTREVRSRFEAAQKRLSDFQRAHGIVGVDRMDLEADRARSLSTELVEAQSAADAAKSRSGSSAVPEVAQSTIVQDLEKEVGLQQGKVAELSRTLGPNHPTMVAAQSQLAALRSALANARATQANALTAASSAASRREAALRAQLDQQQARMIALSGVQDQLKVLQRDVDAARQTYDTVRQRFNEATLQSEIQQP
ncbi:MAG: GumC family protein, partial [Sphingomonas sp.]